jgi:hypothetical protein
MRRGAVRFRFRLRQPDEAVEQPQRFRRAIDRPIGRRKHAIGCGDRLCQNRRRGAAHRAELGNIARDLHAVGVLHADIERREDLVLLHVPEAAIASHRHRQRHRDLRWTGLRGGFGTRPAAPSTIGRGDRRSCRRVRLPSRLAHCHGVQPVFTASRPV